MIKWRCNMGNDDLVIKGLLSGIGAYEQENGFIQ